MLDLLFSSFIYASPAAAIVHATQEDCEIIVEIGKTEGEWGHGRGGGARHFPIVPAPFWPDTPQKDGSIYRADCDWRKFGVTVPMANESSEFMIGIGRPEYDRKHELAFVEKSIVAKPHFLSISQCKLELKDGHWHLIECEVKAIT